jgi:uncharacterized protein (TIGR00661 family)
VKKRTILYGVCGIGNGHALRQLPLIEHFSTNFRIVIFAYDASYEFYSKHFEGNPRVMVVEVAVPFYVGSKDGIDFEATEKLEKNKKDYTGINARACAKAEEIIGLPDLVISDYEPVSAEYAFGHCAPLVTIDQQSKYLFGEFPEELHGQTYADEIARLKLFFPTAVARIACSFFSVTEKKGGEKVLMFPPILRNSVFAMKRGPTEPTSILGYLSSQKEFPQGLEEMERICVSQPEVRFHIFLPRGKERSSFENVAYYPHGDQRFDGILKNCSGIISTAGHTLLSEAMHLGIPVYAIPLSVYEQEMNAEVIDRNGFGIRSDSLSEERLRYFLSNLSRFQAALAADRQVLLRGNGKERIVAYLESMLS